MEFTMKHQVQSLTSIKSRLKSFQNMEKGWNGNGSAAPTEEACKAAWVVCQKLCSRPDLYVYVYPGEFGGVDIEIDVYDEAENLEEEYSLYVSTQGNLLGNDPRSKKWYDELS